MSQNKGTSIQEHSAEWLASCGFIFPSNEIELKRFNALHGSIDSSITGHEVDPFKIINANANTRNALFKVDAVKSIYEEQPIQMVARKRNPFKKGK